LTAAVAAANKQDKDSQVAPCTQKSGEHAIKATVKEEAGHQAKQLEKTLGWLVSACRIDSSLA